MEEADFIWSEETLSAFLESPMQYLPGTTMPFAGLKKEDQRKALICYLKTSQ
jgi:cytochrome c